VRLGDLGEFGLIDRLRERVAEAPAAPCGSAEDPGARVIEGIGDDCAVLDQGDGRALLITTDACIEGTHFYGDAPIVGWKALAASLSDIAAMGGRALAAVVVLGARADTELAAIDAIYGDLLECARHYGVPLVGGDTVATTGPMILATTVVGEARLDRVVRRAGARVDDVVMVVGWLGAARGGFELYRSRREMWDISRAVATHRPRLTYHERLAVVATSLLREGGGHVGATDPEAGHRLETEFHYPLAHLRAGAILAETGKVSAMIDVSDGLSGDATRLACASGVGMRLDAAALPIAPELVTCFGAEEALSLAVRGGEDYALLFTVAPGDADAIEAALAAAHYAPSRIGTVTPEADGLTLHEADGAVRPLDPSASWSHFA
jgi:thiamine-monophosphate kinase